MSGSSVYLIHFLALNAQVSLNTLPEVPLLGNDLRILCEVQIEEILQPFGEIFLQLANGTVLSKTVQSSTSTVILQLSPLLNEDLGRYYCNVSIASPEFPEVGLQTFKAIDLLTLSKSGD